MATKKILRFFQEALETGIIKTLLEQGYSLNQIAEYYQISDHYLHIELRKAGIPYSANKAHRNMVNSSVIAAITNKPDARTFALYGNWRGNNVDNSKRTSS